MLPGSFRRLTARGMRQRSYDVKDIDIIVTHAPTSQTSQTIVGINPELITPSSLQFIAQSGNAGIVVGTVTAIMWPATPLFSGTYSISGPDVAAFLINKSTGVLSLAGDQTTARNYSINVVATRGGVSGSPLTKCIHGCRSPTWNSDYNCR